jgi:hypothetical protein
MQKYHLLLGLDHLNISMLKSRVLMSAVRETIQTYMRRVATSANSRTKLKQLVSFVLIFSQPWVLKNKWSPLCLSFPNHGPGAYA